MNTASLYRTDEDLQRQAMQLGQQDFAQRLGQANLQHADAAASAAVLRGEVLTLRQVIDGMAAEIAKLSAALPPTGTDHQDADDIDGDPTAPRRTDHRLAEAHVAPHVRAAEGAAEPLPDDDATEHAHLLADAPGQGAVPAAPLEAPLDDVNGRLA